MKGLIDSTLREGSQTFGLAFNLTQKKDIYSGLCSVGIEEIEIGLATALDKDLPELMRFCKTHDVNRRLALWSRCRRQDINFAYTLQPDVLSLSIPVSDLHIEKKLGRDRQWVLETAKVCISEARQLGFKVVSLGLEDATRAEYSFLQAIIDMATKCGASRIRIADTVGIANPLELAELIKKIKALWPIEIGVHMHNDFGMATANCMAALDAGADWADATVLGLGERAGNACLEELVSYLICKRDRKYQFESVACLAKKTSQACGRKVEPQKTIIGKEIFSCETGLHIQGLKKDTSTYEPFPPGRVGARRKIRYGEKIGRNELLAQLNGITKDLTNRDVEDILDRVRRKADSIGRPLKETELFPLIVSSL